MKTITGIAIFAGVAAAIGFGYYWGKNKALELAQRVTDK